MSHIYTYTCIYMTHIHMTKCSSKINVPYEVQIANKTVSFSHRCHRPLQNIPKCWIFRVILRQNRRISSLRAKASYKGSSQGEGITRVSKQEAKHHKKDLSMKACSTQPRQMASPHWTLRSIDVVRIPCAGFIGSVLIFSNEHLRQKPGCSLLY